MKILVVCNAGMSSSILVKKIAEHAKSIGEEASVQAVSSSSVADEKGKWDVCLVAPQIKYPDSGGRYARIRNGRRQGCL